MLTKTVKILVFILYLSSSNPPCSKADSVDRLYNKAAEKYHELYQDTSFRKKADNWLKTIDDFEKIHKRFPGHSKAPSSLYNIGNLYRSLFKWNHKEVFIDRSNIAFRQLAHEYPESTLADDALFLLAENYEVYKQDENIAYIEYERLVKFFPKRNATKEAKKKLKKLNPPHRDLQIDPIVKNTLKPMELTTAHYGGLSEKANNQKKSLELVTKVDYWSTSNWSRMVINVKNEVRYKYQILRADKKKGLENRMYMDIYNSFIPNKFKKRIASNDGLIKQARIAQFNKKTTRVVLDLASLERITIFHFELPHQYKIVIDILGKAALNELEIVKKSPLSKEKESPKPRKQNKKLFPGEKQKDRFVSLSKALGLKVKRIIIDPGHGGRDPGALGFKLKEKDLALKLAKSLRQVILQRHPNINVLMTRKKDRFLSLEARTAFANKKRGDLFISLHMNASTSPRVRGIESYILNLTTDNEALTLAAKENQTSLQSISNLQSILNDLMQNSKIHESRELAEKIQKNTIKISKSRNLKVKQAPFFVLLGAHMPAVLVEAGFITNKEENRLLNTTKYRRILAEGIYRGITEYMN